MKIMSNLDFFLEIDPMQDTVVEKSGDNTTVTGFYYGEEDLSWRKQQYTFDKDGNYLGEKEIDSY